MATQGWSDFLQILLPGGGIAARVGLYVRLTSNADSSAYVSGGATDSQGFWSIAAIPPGSYKVATGPSTAGPWTATEDVDYVIAPDVSVIGAIPQAAVSGKPLAISNVTRDSRGMLAAWTENGCTFTVTRDPITNLVQSIAVTGVAAATVTVTRDIYQRITAIGVT